MFRNILIGLLLLTACTPEVNITQTEELERETNTAHSNPIQNGRHTFTVSGREYTVIVPQNAEPNTPLPLLLMFHHESGTGRMQELVTCPKGNPYNAECINALAETEGFIVVHLEGTVEPTYDDRKVWNSGNCCNAAFEQNVDDVGYVEDVLDDLANKIWYDDVYAAGFGNGAMLTYRLACELSDRIDGIAAVAGGMNVDSCAPSQPVSVIHFHGSEDLAYPVEGNTGDKGLAGVQLTSVDETIAFWVKHNNCGAGTTEDIPDVEDDDTTTTVTKYSCDANVQYYLSEGAEHTWPGGEAHFIGFEEGQTAMDFNANFVMLEFFGIN